MTRSHLTFFCELEARPLRELFADGTVIAELQALGAGVSLGIRDLSAGRAAVVRRLNEAGIPLAAWLLLPEEQGYWFNLENAPEAAAFYARFKAWSVAYDLQWLGVGLDIEPHISEIAKLGAGEWRVLPGIIRRFLDLERFRQAQTAYRRLVRQIRADGYCVDSYVIPVIVDERRVGSTLLRRLTGLIDIEVDREVLMLYSSFLRPNGHGYLWSYAPAAQSIAVGSTGGGVTVGGLDQVPPLSWEELSRDLRLSRVWSDDIHIFSLEGAVREGYLKRLAAFDWAAPIAPPFREFRLVERVRRGLRAVLWAGSHPAVILAGMMGLLWLISRLRRKPANR